MSPVDRQGGQTPRRCRWFGHDWRNPSMPHLPTPVWVAGGAEDLLVCSRCGVEFWREGRTRNATLDAVRCAQGRDTDAPERSPQGGLIHQETRREAGVDAPDFGEPLSTRSPQGEDHEAGIQAAARVIWEQQTQQRDAGQIAEAAIAAYLSRCPSPERLGELLDGETK